MFDGFTLMRLAVPCVLVSAIGCSGPTVLVIHTLPAAVPVADLSSKFVPGSFTVEGQPNGKIASLAAKLLAEHMPETWRRTSRQANGSTLEVAGLVHIKAEDRATKRGLLRRDAAGKELREVEVPSLVRRVCLETRFVVTQAGAPEPLVTVETRKSYDSTADPRVRGELGLSRNDDPEKVPPTDEIVTELLVECIQEFWQMVTPTVARKEIALKPVGGPDAAAGFRAVEAGDLASAVEHFRKAARAKPDEHNALFDLAVVREATGKLTEALEDFRQAAKLASSEDTEAAEGAKRVHVVMIQQGKSVK